MSLIIFTRRNFLKAITIAPMLSPWASAVGNDTAEGNNTATNAYRSVLLSKKGGDRATAYVMCNKIARRNGHLVCTWIDSSRQNRWAIVDPVDGKILHQGAVGEPRFDNHSGASITTAPDGALHLLTGDHHRPFVHFRMSPNSDNPIWEPVADGKAIGIMSTYPSLVCDQQGTLHLAYRHRQLPHYTIDYCRRPKNGTWSKPRPLIRASVTDHTWMTNAIEVGPEGRLHMVLSNTISLPDSARYYGASHIYSDDSGETWRQFGDARPLELPVDVPKLKRIEGDDLAKDRIEQNVKPWYERPLSLNSYNHQLLLSNVIVDDSGRPWTIVHNLLAWDAKLYHAEDGKWIGVPLLPAVNEILPQFQITHCAQLSRHKNGTIEAVLMVAPKGAREWGGKKTELVRIPITPGGQVGQAQLVCKPNPEIARWLPSIERWTWNAPNDNPALLFTQGFNASNNKNKLNMEVWLQIPD